MKLIRARFGHHVDKTAGKVGIFHIERRKLNRGFAYNIEWQRQSVTRCKWRAVKAKDIRLDDAIHGESVRAVIAAKA